MPIKWNMFSYETCHRKRRFLDFISFLVVLLNIVPTHADDRTNTCAMEWDTVRSAIEKASRPPALSPAADFQEILGARTAITKVNAAAKANAANQESSTLQARVTRFRAHLQRLVEPQYDYTPAFNSTGMWSKMTLPIEEGPIPIHDLMKAQADWQKGLAFINADAFGQPLSLDLLKEIHKRACENMAFRGFEGRRIAKKFKDGEISKEEFRALLNRAYKDEAVSGTDHKKLVGELRSDPLDQLAHHGNKTDANGRRFMTEAEFAGLSNNPNLSLIPGSVTKEPDGKIRAEFRYLDVAKVESAVKEILERTNSKIKTAKTLEEKVRVVVTMQRDLLSAHPFLDGNGRTVRLVADLLYNRMGLPHPARPNERDLEMPIDDSVEFIRQQMIKTLRIENGEIDL